jgi:hypothetical protein
MPIIIHIIEQLSLDVLAIIIYYRGLKYFSFLFFGVQIIPPGIEFGHMIHDFEMDGDEDSPCPASEDPSIWSEVAKLFSDLYMPDHFPYSTTESFYGLFITFKPALLLFVI